MPYNVYSHDPEHMKDAEYCRNVLQSTISSIVAMYNKTGDPNFQKVLNEVGPTLIAMRLKIEHFIETERMRIDKENLQENR